MLCAAHAFLWAIAAMDVAQLIRCSLSVHSPKRFCVDDAAIPHPIRVDARSVHRCISFVFHAVLLYDLHRSPLARVRVIESALLSEEQHDCGDGDDAVSATRG